MSPAHFRYSGPKVIRTRNWRGTGGMIVKVQRPLYTPPGQREMWLVYDRGREFEATIATENLPPEVLASMGDSLKGYFRAFRQADGALAFAARLTDQPW